MAKLCLSESGQTDLKNIFLKKFVFLGLNNYKLKKTVPDVF